MPRAARTNRKERELLSATGDPHTEVCRLVRRLRLARADGGPHVPKDSSPHLVTPQRLTAVRANPAVGAAGPPGAGRRHPGGRGVVVHAA